MSVRRSGCHPCRRRRATVARHVAAHSYFSLNGGLRLARPVLWSWCSSNTGGTPLKTCIFVLTLALAAPAMAVDSFNGNWGEFEDGLFAALLFNAADVERIVVHPDGEWAVMLPDQVLSSPGFPGTALWVLEFYVDNAPAAELRAFEFTDSVHFVAVDSWGAWRYGAAPGFDALADFVDDSVQGEQVRALALTPAGDGWVVATDRRAAALNAPTALTAALDDCIEVGRQPDHVAFVSGGWAVMCDQWAATGGLAGHGLRSRISSYQRSGFPVRFMVGSGEAYMLGADHSRPADDGSPLWDMEYNFGGQNIWKQMADADVEGVQIAYFDGTETVVPSLCTATSRLAPTPSGVAQWSSCPAAPKVTPKQFRPPTVIVIPAVLATGPPVNTTAMVSPPAGSPLFGRTFVMVRSTACVRRRVRIIVFFLREKDPRSKTSLVSFGE